MIATDNIRRAVEISEAYKTDAESLELASELVGQMPLDELAEYYGGALEAEYEQAMRQRGRRRNLQLVR